MMSIDKLIYDALARRRSVVLPGAGTLEVKRHGAQKISETQIIPPQNVVTFTPDEVEGVGSAVSLVVADSGVDEQEAVAAYGSWLEGARRPDGTIAIEGVGEIGAGGFVVAEGLHDALNPTGREIVTMGTEKKQASVWVWVIIALLVALGALLLWKKTGVFCGSSKKQVVETVETAAITEPGGESAGDTATDGAAPSGAVTAGGAAVTPSGSRFHVIAGAFSIESNADNLIAKLKRELPELTPQKIVNPSTGYHMVSIIQAPTRRQASSKMNLYWDVNLYLWIYEQP